MRYSIRPVKLDAGDNSYRLCDPTDPDARWGIYASMPANEDGACIDMHLADAADKEAADAILKALVKDDEITFLETLVDISCGLSWGHTRLDGEDSRNNVDLIIQAAVDFETRNAETDWTQVDFFDAIYNYVQEITTRNSR